MQVGQKGVVCYLLAWNDEMCGFACMKHKTWCSLVFASKINGFYSKRSIWEILDFYASMSPVTPVILQHTFVSVSKLNVAFRLTVTGTGQFQLGAAASSFIGRQVGKLEFLRM